MPRSRDNFERRTQWNTNRHHRSTGVAATVVLSILTIGCGAEHGKAKQPTATVVTGFSTNHDPSINETSTTRGYSDDHDSRINDDPGLRP